MGLSIDGSMGSWVVGLVCPWVGRSASPGGVVGTSSARTEHVPGAVWARPYGKRSHSAAKRSPESQHHVFHGFRVHCFGQNVAILQPEALRTSKTSFSIGFNNIGDFIMLKSAIRNLNSRPKYFWEAKTLEH